MGIDYFRFRTTLPPSELQDLVARQGLAAQSMWGMGHIGRSRDHDPTLSKLLCGLHETTYREASEALESLLEFPDLSEETRQPTDIPDLSWTWRIAVISANPIFPPAWRVAAHRTILPHELPVQLNQWQTWISEVTAGDHAGYLGRLLLYHDSDVLRLHWSHLQRCVASSYDKPARWANTSEIREIRDRIVRLPEPQVISAEEIIHPVSCRIKDVQEAIDSLSGQVQLVNSLTREWNYHAKQNYRMQDYRGQYIGTVERFRSAASAAWLSEFLVWTQRCADEGFGLFYDF